MENILILAQSASGITTAIGLCAFVAVLIFGGFSVRLRQRQREVESLPESDRIAYLKSWKNLDISKISGRDATELIGREIDSKNKLYTRTIIALSVVFLVSLFLILFPRSSQNEEACVSILRQADQLRDRGKDREAIEKLEDNFADCTNYKYEFAKELGYLNRDIKQYEQALSWHQKALSAVRTGENFTNGDLVEAISAVGYAYEGIGDWASSLQRHQQALDASQPDTKSHRSAIFSIANAELAIGTENGSSDLIAAAKRGFQRFVSSDDPHKQFAYLNLACIDAIDGDLGGFSKNLSKSIELVNNLSRRAKYAAQKAFIKKYVLSSGSLTNEPTWPQRCLSMDQALEDCECSDHVKLALKEI